ncbi:hypothetical protein HDU91_005795 [Kappamyces sp. JEL0680]|nr:hypothetical protein HDU91_005795 [Kappamyces sp. JEL0680]
MVAQWVDDEKSVGFSLAQFITSLFWGWASDRWGRRPILLVGLVGNSVSIVLFGLSNSLGMAIASRALNGLLNGNSGVAKSMLAEITDSSNRPKAFSLFGLCFAIGIMVGPLLGGLLANPAQTMPSLFGSWDLFVRNPYLLPCLVSSFISTFGFVFGIFFLPETNKRLVAQDPERTALLSARQDAEEVRVEGGLAPVTAAAAPCAEKGIGAPAVSAVTAYSALCLLIVMFDEIYSLWGNSPLGMGLGFSPAELGASLSPMGVVLISTQMFVYPWMSGFLNQLQLYRFAIAGLCFVFIGFPLISSVVRVTPSIDYLTWPLLEVTLSFRFFLGTLCFTTVMLLVSDSAKPGQLGLVNGYGQMTASFMRTIGPSLAGSLFAWSNQSGLAFPFDKHFIWGFLGLICVSCTIQSMFITLQHESPKPGAAPAAGSVSGSEHD